MDQMSTGKCMINWWRKGGDNEQLPGLINVGSCGLHVVHGAFRSDAQKTKLGIDSIFKALYKLFDESSAKREDYSAITRNNTFPLPFCGNRWAKTRKLQREPCKFGQDVMVYIRETVKKPKGEVSSIILLHYNQAFCTGLSDNCQARVHCFHGIHHGTIPADVSG